MINAVEIAHWPSRRRRWSPLRVVFIHAKTNASNETGVSRIWQLLEKRHGNKGYLFASLCGLLFEELKNLCEMEHARRHSPVNFLINLFAGPDACSCFEKKPAVKFQRSLSGKQLELFYLS